MGLIIATVRNQRSLGTTATTLDEDIRFAYNAHSLHVDLYSLKNSGSAATIQNLIDKVTTIKLNTQNGTPSISIDGDDLHDANILVNGSIPYHAINTSTDNIPHSMYLQYALSPFWDDPLRNFGAGPNSMTQLLVETAADGTQTHDGFTYDITVEGVDAEDKPNSLGYIRMNQDAYTSGAVAEIHPTLIGPCKRILGIMNFQTTSYDDLAASAAVDVTGIRRQGISFSEKIQFEYRPARSGSMKKVQDVASFAAAAAQINLLDNGRFYADFGTRNDSGLLGIAYQQNSKVQTTAGVAEATRVIPTTLV